MEPWRRESVEKVKRELDEFKVEIQKWFKYSKINKNFCFPRIIEKGNFLEEQPEILKAKIPETKVSRTKDLARLK